MSTLECINVGCAFVFYAIIGAILLATLSLLISLNVALRRLVSALRVYLLAKAAETRVNIEEEGRQ